MFAVDAIKLMWKLYISRSNDQSWDDPMGTLRTRWSTLPVTPTLGALKKSEDLLKMSDKDLMKMWATARNVQIAGKGFGIRGWFHLLYEDYFRGRKVMAVGDGLGYDGITFAQTGAEVTFVDIVQSNLDVVARISKMIGKLNTDYLYMNDISSLAGLAFDYDVILAIGSLHNAPFEVMRPEALELWEHLRPGGRWIQLAYPQSRWIRDGRMPFSTWGIKTDGLGTPWAEWYDLDKLGKLLAPAQFETVLYLEFDNHNYNWFDLRKKW